MFLRVLVGLQVKDQMVWMMLKERKELQDKLDSKIASYKALEVPALAPLRFAT
jgi:hypothetical protein